MGLTTLDDLGGWPAVLGPLVDGRDIGPDAARSGIAAVLAGEAEDAHIAAFATLLLAKGPTPAELGAVLSALVDAATPIIVEGDFVDTCGTGGSPQRRSACFNVSTVASFVVAGAGATVVKHGGRAASATSSSAELVEALGVSLELSAEGVARCAKEAGMAFVFAPSFHPAARHVAPVRRQLGVPTIFNFVLPLANPARPRRQLVGVSRPDLAPVLLEVLIDAGAERAMVVSGDDGLDELTTTTTSTIYEWADGERRTWKLDPRDLGIAVAAQDEIRGGDVAVNAQLAREVLSGKPGPHADIVALNAAGALTISGLAGDVEHGLHLAREVMADGRASSILDRLIEVSLAAASG